MNVDDVLNGEPLTVKHATIISFLWLILVVGAGIVLVLLQGVFAGLFT